MGTVDFAAFDADNHYYEATDAFTRHLPKGREKLVTWATIGGKQECLVNVPKWDFHWQLDYMLAEPINGPVQVSATCVWDNTAANQPVINGMQLQPRQIMFGEESLAEMCLHYIWVSRPNNR